MKCLGHNVMEGLPRRLYLPAGKTEMSLSVQLRPSSSRINRWRSVDGHTRMNTAAVAARGCPTPCREKATLHLSIGAAIREPVSSPVAACPIQSAVSLRPYTGVLGTGQGKPQTDVVAVVLGLHPAHPEGQRDAGIVAKDDGIVTQRADPAMLELQIGELNKLSSWSAMASRTSVPPAHNICCGGR